MLLTCASICRALGGSSLESSDTSFASVENKTSFFVPNATNAVRLRIFLDAAPDAAQLFNGLEIVADGETLLKPPPGNRFAAAPDELRPFFHSVLINGTGPKLGSANGMKVLEIASGPEWYFVRLDAGAAYQPRLTYFKRGILFVEPNLFVIHDSLAAEKPFQFKMFLHPPVGARIDPVWGDLRFDGDRAGFRIQAPGGQKSPRNWKRVTSGMDELLPGTITVELGPTNQLSRLELVTVFAVERAGAKTDFAFRLLEGTGAIGVRIHRDGLPTLAAFKNDPQIERPSVTGFGFAGPVGVDVYHPKSKRR